MRRGELGGGFLGRSSMCRRFGEGSGQRLQGGFGHKIRDLLTDVHGRLTSSCTERRNALICRHRATSSGIIPGLPIE